MNAHSLAQDRVHTSAPIARACYGGRQRIGGAKITTGKIPEEEVPGCSVQYPTGFKEWFLHGRENQTDPKEGCCSKS